MPIASQKEWGNFIQEFPNTHILQTAAWGDLKASFGWETAWVIQSTASKIGAQLLFRKLLPGITMAYIPKGPVFNPRHPLENADWDGFWKDIGKLCRDKKAIFLKVEPDIWIKSESLRNEAARNPAIESSPDLPVKKPQASIHPGNFRTSLHTIQPLRTIVIPLQGDEQSMLAQMKQKTRYNVKLALKHGVTVKQSSDIEKFYELMCVTGERDGFGIHNLSYYKKVWENFSPTSDCVLLLAEHQGEVLAGIMVLKHLKRSWYFYGASNNIKRELMPTYLLQWEAIRWTFNQGCLEYDLWGVPDHDLSFLEANFQNRSDQLWGVYRFKRGFGGDLRRSAGPWDWVFNQIMYRVYHFWTKWKAGSNREGM